jgi:8-oxo-dGTP pyrophosphatase MutT (NUDIX family)
MSVMLWSLASVVLLLFVGSCLLRANRLDRLHIRTDAARAALMAALERRAVVTRAVALHLDDEGLRGAATRAEHAATDDRELQENELSGLLAGVVRTRLPLALRNELADAEQRVMIARRVYNDAVRDTRALRSRRLVRWLRMAGTAPVPAYFEIADTGTDDEQGAQNAARAPASRRTAGRVLLLDPAGRVLLFEGTDPARPQETFWFTPGGGAEPGESCRCAAVREVAEETGLRLDPDDLVGPVWCRDTLFTFDGASVHAYEEFFVSATDLDAPDMSGFTQLETDTVLGYRWWSEAELRETEAVVFPRGLGGLLSQVSAERWDGVTRRVG